MTPNLSSKLIIKAVDFGATGVKLLLHDEHGKMLPCQVATEVRCTVGPVDEITVTFLIDGTNVVLAS